MVDLLCFGVGAKKIGSIPTPTILALSVMKLLA